MSRLSISRHLRDEVPINFPSVLIRSFLSVTRRAFHYILLNSNICFLKTYCEWHIFRNPSMHVHRYERANISRLLKANHLIDQINRLDTLFQSIPRSGTSWTMKSYIQTCTAFQWHRKGMKKMKEQYDYFSLDVACVYRANDLYLEYKSAC